MFTYRPAGTWGSLVTPRKTHILAGESILGGRTRCGQDRITNYARGGYIVGTLEGVRAAVTCDGCLVWAAKQLGNVNLTYRVAQDVLVSWGRCEDFNLDPADGGPWVTQCEEHGNNVQHASKRLAQSWAGDPITWCYGCQNALRVNGKIVREFV